jgi:hypothetical protein
LAVAFRRLKIGNHGKHGKSTERRIDRQDRQGAVHTASAARLLSRLYPSEEGLRLGDLGVLCGSKYGTAGTRAVSGKSPFRVFRGQFLVRADAPLI